MELGVQVLNVLKAVFDPEIPISVVDLGLIYGIDIDAEKMVTVTMTMTTRGCPVHSLITEKIRSSLDILPWIKKTHGNLVWDPPWTPDRRFNPDIRISITQPVR